MPTKSIGSRFEVNPRARVLQHLHAVSSKRRRHVVIVVVIAEDAEHAMRRGQRRQRVGGRADEVAIAPA